MDLLTKTEIFRASNEAIVRHLDSVTVAIVVVKNGSPTDPDSFVGSGTCISVGDRKFVATCAHNLAGVVADEIFLVPKGGAPLDSRISIKGMGHRGGDLKDAVDIGWIELDDASAVSLGKTFVPASRLRLRWTPPDWLLLSGYPGQWIDQNLLVKKVLRLQPIGYYTHALEGVELAKTKLNPTYDVVLDYNQGAALASLDGRVVSVPDAPGLSGGGVWASNIHLPGVWSPESAELVAIDRSWHKGEQWARATRIDYWVEMLRQDIPALDAVLPR